MANNKVGVELSACEYLENHSSHSNTDLNELIQIYQIKNKHDVEQLIIYAISYCKFNIINALFNHKTGYADQLLDLFHIDINSLYSTDCLSLIPKIKVVDTNHTSKVVDTDLSNLFSQNIIDNSKQIEYDNQIQLPHTSIVSRSIFKHLMTSNEHIKADMHMSDLTVYEYEYNRSVTIYIKPCYMSYFDHCMLLGHYTIGLNILELGGWNTFLNGNFMIYIREMIIKQLQAGKSYEANLIYYRNIVATLYKMGGDIHNIYHNRIINGLAYLYDTIKDCKDIFETRQIALTKILQHVTNFNFDVCFMLTRFVPYINQKMIQKLPHQRGMVLSSKNSKIFHMKKLMFEMTL